MTKLLRLILISCTVSAWHVPPLARSSTKPALHNDRRTFCLQTPVVVVASLLTMTTTSPQPAMALSADAAAAQWKAAAQTIDNLLSNWDSISKGGGDAIRTQLGTQGITSPLFQIDKALKVLRDSAEDLVEFTEMTDEFLLNLSRADSMAYSANFAGGSGKPTPPAVYIEKSRVEVLDLQKLAKSLSAQL